MSQDPEGEDPTPPEPPQHPRRSTSGAVNSSPSRRPHDADLATDAEREARITARLSHQLALQWAQVREERRQAPEPAPIAGGPSNFSRAQVP